MVVTVDLDAILNNLINDLGSAVYFILICSENGVIKKSYINEEEFNKSSIAVNISQLYELAEDITNDVGIKAPDFNIIHSDNYYIFSIKILDIIIILLTIDQVDVKQIFQVINSTTSLA